MARKPRSPLPTYLKLSRIQITTPDIESGSGVPNAPPGNCSSFFPTTPQYITRTTDLKAEDVILDAVSMGFLRSPRENSSTSNRQFPNNDHPYARFLRRKFDTYESKNGGESLFVEPRKGHSYTIHNHQGGTTIKSCQYPIRIGYERELLLSSNTPGLEVAEQPIAEILRRLGSVHLFGEHMDPQLSTGNLSPSALHVSSLNAYTLYRIGRIQIHWLQSSLDTVFSRIISEYKYLEQQDNILRVNPIDDFLYEVILSYKLIFGQNRRSAGRYQRVERKQLIRQGDSDPVDPLLDKLCGFRNRKQVHVAKQQLSRLSELWNDHRDELRRYALWAVVLFSSIGILLGVLQLVASVAQTVISWKAYQQQDSQRAAF
ncbi:hypothetical protein AJ80_03210 [Polytolypa hystricis UAMH7299]|uniref:Uncharacterized protein n=1 Tax=Polytolypa hystricis (strain UAMH7299) TaxID=1447883 RepID=A0A2B7YK36_POLH7|nr:hypothetical protein AJ80_03210 [Polytolypa hystricis UAMH7299]